MKYERRQMLGLLGAGCAFTATSLLSCTDGAKTIGTTDAGAENSGPPPDACEADFWLCGNHRPVDEVEAHNLEVEGALPPSLNGLYLRNGPNPLSGSSPHWFSGDGMVHGLALADGNAQWFRSRYVQTEVLGAAPVVGPPGLAQHAANTSVLRHGGRLLALAEAGLPYELSPTDLSTIGVYDFDGALNSAMTAHPKVDPRTGQLLFFGAGVQTPTIHYHEVDPAGVLVRTEVIPIPKPVLMHDFQITASYVVFYDLPLVFDLERAVANGGLGHRWTPSNGARIGVLPRGAPASEIRWFEIEPCYIFHGFNAYEDSSAPGTIILDAVRYAQMWVDGPSDFDHPNQLSRYTIDLNAGQVSRESLDERSIEFPRIDARRVGREHRYGYAVFAPPGGVGGSEEIVKFDFKSGTSTSYRLQNALVTGEMTFVPGSKTAGEDEGWLLSYGYDGSLDAGRLLVFDATDIARGPVARVRLPTRVPFGFHGDFFPS